VTPGTFAEAEKLMQVTMTPAERQQAADTWRTSLAQYLERRTGPRKVAIAATDSPAALWNPMLPGIAALPARDQFVRSKPDGAPPPSATASYPGYLEWLTRERRWHVLVPGLVTALGLALSAWFSRNTPLAMTGLVLATAEASSAQAAFWSLPAAFLGGAAAAAGIALVNSLGNIAGFASTFLVGWMTDLTHSTSASLYLFAGLLAIGSVLILTIPARLVNK